MDAIVEKNEDKKQSYYIFIHSTIFNTTFVSTDPSEMNIFLLCSLVEEQGKPQFTRLKKRIYNTNGNEGFCYLFL